MDDRLADFSLAERSALVFIMLGLSMLLVLFNRLATWGFPGLKLAPIPPKLDWLLDEPADSIVPKSMDDEEGDRLWPEALTGK